MNALRRMAQRSAEAMDALQSALQPDGVSAEAAEIDAPSDDAAAAERIMKIINGELAGPAMGWNAIPFDDGEIEITIPDGRKFHVAVGQITDD
jgi:hypothetical protein